MNLSTILFVIEWRSNGGAEKQLLLIAEKLAQNGFPCKIIAFSRAKSNKAFDLLEQKARAAGVEIFKPAECFKKLYLPSILKLLFEIFKLKFNCILWSWGTRADLICRTLKTIFKVRIKLINSIRSANSDKCNKKSLFDRLLLNCVDLFVSNSQAGVEIHQAGFQTQTKRYSILRNYLSTCDNDKRLVKEFKANDFVNVGMLGNIRLEIKGYDRLIEVASKCKELGLPFKFYIGGKDFSNGALTQLIKDNDLHDNVIWCNEVHNQSEFFSKLDVFLLLSRIEGTPNSLLEAMQFGLPVIATDAGDVKYIIKHQQNGLFVKNPFNVQEVVSYLDWIAQNHQIAVKMGEEGKISVVNMYSEKFITKDLLSIVTSL